MKPAVHATGLPRATQLDAALRLWGMPGSGREELLDDQAEKLRALIGFAAREVPFYRELFERLGLDPSVIRSAGDLGRLPVLSKLALRERAREDLMPGGADPNRLIADRSSGSTGIKLLLWREPFELHLMQLYRMRAWLQVGIRPYHRMARVNSAFGRWSRSSMRLSRLRQAIRVFHATQIQARQSPEDVLSRLVACRPDVMTGYAGVLHEVARIVALGGETRLRPRLVLCGGETLTAPMRRVIEGALDTRVIDFYGAMEFNLVAWECPQTGLYHVDEDALVLELLRPDGRPVDEGEEGEVVVTGLHAYAFPLIRYTLGDLAVRGPTPCPCGAPFATLARIQGRTVEYYYRGDGSAVYHWQLSSALNQSIPGSVNRYQIVQEGDGRIAYRVMPLRELGDDQIATLYRVGAEVLGAETPFEVRVEEEIPCAPSGKMLQSVNHMHNSTGRPSWDPANTARDDRPE